MPKIGMRSIKTAVAVAICYFLFTPFQRYGGGVFALLDAFSACVAAAVCIQSSLEESVRLGLYRLIGTVVGGFLGLLVLLVSDVSKHILLTGLILGLSILLCIWLCNLLGIQAACGVACMVLCLVLLNYNGEYRYTHTLLRIVETAVGVLVALGVNRILPDHRFTPPGRREMGEDPAVSPPKDEPAEEARLETEEQAKAELKEGAHPE